MNLDRENHARLGEIDNRNRDKSGPFYIDIVDVIVSMHILSTVAIKFPTYRPTHCDMAHPRNKNKLSPSWFLPLY